ncbi:cell division protein ZapE [Hyphomicrobium methylovorum]|uniref:cell division protein ZapE n=1 Tax=Hyphomicrobium methylovorum TaxID=84 RepID=UPI0015E7BB72|nr:cell division protein ZapE [Hyphomicrobium methylovorum]MBA2126090.1 cell division protein ZapE [Hyphomicrobium methylovorum]
MGTIIDVYQQRLADREIEPDAAQMDLARRLDALQVELMTAQRSQTTLARLLGRRATPPKGLYIWGSVGRGKSMLMDLFFEETEFERKRRAHFHEFMADVHERIAAAREETPGDPIPHVARALTKDAQLLCFDELQVTDIADAMILGRLFDGLFAGGTTVVATSNAHPTELYKNGLNRQLFLPFIDHLTAHLDVVELKSEKDFRLDKLSGAQLYFYPDDDAARAELDAHWLKLTGKRDGKPRALEVKGRTLVVPSAAAGVARFPFEDLCDRPLGTGDYLAIAHAFHTVIIDHIPILSPERRDIARRFINLVDALYDGRICLIASAAAKPAALYPKGDGADLFQRTASRLMEMRSEAYLAGHSGGRWRR